MSITNLSVLIVSTEAGVTEPLKTMFSRRGLGSVHTIDRGDRVFALIEQHKPDFLIIDEAPPDIDAVGLVGKIRRDSASPDPRLKVFVTMGRSSIERMLEVLEAGAHEVMLKPFDDEKLLIAMHANITDPRPFLQTEIYVGPDRRRASKSEYAGPRRRAEDRLVIG